MDYKVTIPFARTLIDLSDDPETYLQSATTAIEIAKAEKFIKSVIDQINESATAQSEEHPTYFLALNDPYTYGGVGNDLMNYFYAHRRGGGIASADIIVHKERGKVIAALCQRRRLAGYCDHVLRGVQSPEDFR